ncbi:hypothetical protein SH601_04165 [Gracilibacillus sp. S3-1-1]|uniref:Uncharacterized protein n=1 Tax=Gracilibacillus pellucidus TaxID=3095368 RepID=A0ACC6M2J6_9BACI|nr:hypothetical protein [Gracilibacillus sp. S3-1-1]MDX8045175.1 hypothetical protein [Gracilibacillus sp. S3-1-1]
MTNQNWLDETSRRLDHLFDSLFVWLSEQFDPITGGFYYARSSVQGKQFAPDIESTAQAINILLRYQLLDQLPQETKAKLISFFQKKQDVHTGYFYDENPNMKKDEVMVHRALAYAQNSLKRLGSKPLFALPVEQQVAPSYTESLSAYQEKWDSIELSNSWRGCDLLASTTVYFSQMEKAKKAQYVEAFAKYLAEKQDRDTGLWGEGSLYVRISGTFKLHTFYRRHRIPMPNQAQMYQTILTCLRTEEAMDMCYIRNPIDLISYMKPAMTEKELKEISVISVHNMERLKRRDGAFSRELAHSPKAPNVAQVKQGDFYPNMPAAVEIGAGLIEGDMNATTQATLIREQLHQLWGKQKGSIPTTLTGPIITGK